MQHSGEQFIIIHEKNTLWNLTEIKKVLVENSGTVIQWGEVKEIFIQTSNALVDHDDIAGGHVFFCWLWAKNDQKTAQLTI